MPGHAMLDEPPSLEITVSRHRVLTGLHFRSRFYKHPGRLIVLSTGAWPLNVALA